MNYLITNAHSYFDGFVRKDYARGGMKAPKTVVLPAGAVKRGFSENDQDLEPFPNSLESQLRSLGCPTLLKNGTVTLNGEYVVCKEGQTLTHDQAKILVFH